MTDAKGEILILAEKTAACLKAGKRTVYRFAAEGGKLPGFKLSGTRRFRRSDLGNKISGGK